MRLFYEDEFDAINDAITSSGKGYKAIAQQLWPAKKPESAYARLKSCLSVDGDQRLTFGEIILICKLCDRYDPLLFMCDELAHERPKAVTKEEELAGLIRQYLEATKSVQKLGPVIERLRAA